MIEVEGNNRISDETVIAYAGVEIGENILAISKTKIEQGLISDPYLTVDKIERKLPNTLIIHVKEQPVLAAVLYDKQYLMISQEGTVLEIAGDHGGSIQVTGLGVSAAVLGARVQGPSEYQLYVIKEICAWIDTLSVKDHLISLDVTDPTMMTMKTKTGITIILGTEDNLDIKKEWMESVLPRLIHEGKRYGTLDITGSSGANFIP